MDVLSQIPNAEVLNKLATQLGVGWSSSAGQADDHDDAQEVSVYFVDYESLPPQYGNDHSTLHDFQAVVFFPYWYVPSKLHAI